MPVMDIIADAAQEEHLVKIRYRKPTGEMKNYTCEPYSVRNGAVYMFDVSEGHIKRFTISRILNVEELDQEFDPRWEVEF